MDYFFHDLNKRLNDINKKSLTESAVAEVAHDTGKKLLSKGERSSLAKKARAGKDIGKPGKMFKKVAADAAKRYGSKEAGERVAAAAMFKNAAKNEGIGDTVKKVVKKGLEKLGHGSDEAMRKDLQKKMGLPQTGEKPKKVADEGNAFTAALKATPKGGKFKVGGKEFTDTSSIEEKKEPRSKGTAFDKDYMDQQRKKEQGTGKFDAKKTSTGTVYTRKPETFDDDGDETSTSSEPKRRGRPKGKAKGPERVTAKAWKHKGGRKEKTKEDLDTDGVMMTKASNMSSECVERGEEAEYNDEAGMAKDSLHTIVRHAKELESALRSNENLPEWVQEKIGQIKGMMSSVTDYIISSHERDIEQHTGREGVTMEKAPPGAKAERMVKHIKKSLSKDGKLSDKDKAIAYATTWKAHKQGKVEEAGKPDFLDLDKDGNKAEPMKQAAKQAKGKKKEVEETTTAGSVAPVQNAAPKSGKGMQFGKGVYEGMNKKFTQMLNESMSVNVSMTQDENGEPHKNITVSAEGEDAEALAQLLKMAGLGGHGDTCPKCGSSNCGCEELDENSPDWPTNTEKIDADPNLRTYSGGLNGPKSTGQSTTVGGGLPNLQARRQASMEESVELEKSLMSLYKEFK